MRYTGFEVQPSMIEGVDEGAAGGLLEEARREVARQRAAELDRHLGAGSPGMAAEASAQPPTIGPIIFSGAEAKTTVSPARSICIKFHPIRLVQPRAIPESQSLCHPRSRKP